MLYARAASQSEAASSNLQFPYWCRILELVRTGRAVGGGAANPPQKMQEAKPHRSKPPKSPEKNIGANPILNFGKGKFLVIINSI